MGAKQVGGVLASPLLLRRSLLRKLPWLTTTMALSGLSFSSAYRVISSENRIYSDRMIIYTVRIQSSLCRRD